MLRYYGHYNNKSRGMRRAAQLKFKTNETTAPPLRLSAGASAGNNSS
jgi:hypothetical protein